LKKNFLSIKNSLPKHVNLLAVSKGFHSSNIIDLHNLGQHDFGESKVQEALQKKRELETINQISWHFIGQIQSNKIRKIVENFRYIHSVDSYEKLLKIAKIAVEIKKIPILMIQVKLADDPSKGGIFFDELIRRWGDIKRIQGIKVNGLMTINPKGLSSNENLKLFKKCRTIADTLELTDCSMGMSNDWEEAVEAGSTWLRLGSLLFGKRYL
tara:strand:- start:2828 stop:3463 length:636 start_codon:yes stop_codon:yes gene_type:complete